MKQISEALSVVSGGDSESGIEENLTGASHYKGVESKLHPLIQKYLIVRAIGFVPMIMFLAISDFSTVSLLSKM
jgi:hypothetical protein